MKKIPGFQNQKTMTMNKSTNQLIFNMKNKNDTIDSHKCAYIQKFKFKFGKHKDKTYEEIPISYLLWAYHEGFFDNDQFKYNQSIRKYIYFRYSKEKERKASIIPLPREVNFILPNLPFELQDEIVTFIRPISYQLLDELKQLFINDPLNKNCIFLEYKNLKEQEKEVYKVELHYKRNITAEYKLSDSENENESDSEDEDDTWSNEYEDITFGLDSAMIKKLKNCFLFGYTFEIYKSCRFKLYYDNKLYFFSTCFPYNFKDYERKRIQ